MGLVVNDAAFAGAAGREPDGALGAEVTGVETGGLTLDGRAGFVGSIRSAVLSKLDAVGLPPGMMTEVFSSPEGGAGGAFGSATEGALVDRIGPLGGSTGFGGAGGSLGVMESPGLGGRGVLIWRV